MIQFNRFTLENGLRVIVHEDQATPFVVVNVTYNVGARDEHPERTGFAHLFEHLMFGGSKNAPVFDRPLELAGASNNAFTNNDITNYYEVVPKTNLETALWLESDRMAFLNIDENSLEVQRKVVIEEFKERYLNKPYGETWHQLRTLAYKEHPYQWPTIGKNIQHIEEASLDDVQQFYDRFYHPNNAILTLAGNINEQEAREFTQKWFGDLEAGPDYTRDLPEEPKQTEIRRKETTILAPANSVHMAFHMPGRGEEGYYECDLLSDVLGNGESARLNQSLIKEKQIFSSIDSYVMGSFEPGLFIISGKPKEGVSKKEAEEAIQQELQKIMTEPLPNKEVQKIKNNAEASLTFQMIKTLYKAFHLAFYEVMGDANKVNDELENYQQVTTDSLQKKAKDLFREENTNILWQIAK